MIFFSWAIKEYKGNQCQVLQCLRNNQLYANMSKHAFFKTKNHDLGHIILGDGMFVDPSKLEPFWNGPCLTIEQGLEVL